MKSIQLTLICVLAISFLAFASEKKQKSPNIILIVADDLGYSDLSCYRKMHNPLPDRASTAQTPNIDKLAKEGMLFTDFYAGAAVCSPSRAALLTGRNCTRVGIYNWIPPKQPMHLRDGEITIGEMLRDNGYQTAHFGKWHLTAEDAEQPLPEDQGFDYSFFAYNNAIPSHRNPNNYFRGDVPVGELEGYACHLVVDEALGWLKKHDESKKPFYINIWFNEPHNKVAAPKELADRHQKHPEYYGCIENMDLAVGRVLEYLEEAGIDEETLIIYTSDNGSQVLASNDPLRGYKVFNYEGGIRVPFMVRWTGKIPEGEVTGIPGNFTDILPTMAKITGAKLPKKRVIDGQDLSPVFLGNGKDFKREKDIFFFRYFHDPVCMLRNENWVMLGYIGEKLPWQRMYNGKTLANIKPTQTQWKFQEGHMEYLKTATPINFELYDVNTDISQKIDVVEDNPKIAEKMKKRMLKLREEMINEGGNWYE